jgi:hypothetical protein
MDEMYIVLEGYILVERKRNMKLKADRVCPGHAFGEISLSQHTQVVI